MYLQFNENKYKIIDLVSYNSKSFVVQIESERVLDISNTNLFFELYSDDNKRLKAIKYLDYSNHYISHEENSNLCTITFSNEIKKNAVGDDEKSIEIIRKEILNKLAEELSQKIKDGVFLPTSLGLKQFSFEEHDQRNIANIYNYLQNDIKITEYFYHANGEFSVLYSREDLLLLYETMLAHITEWTEQYRQLRRFINQCEDIAKIIEINLHTNIDNISTITK